MKNFLAKILRLLTKKRREQKRISTHYIEKYLAQQRRFDSPNY